MILRKPYAFFIKHFKLFNIILTILEVYMIYKLSFLIQFLFEYPNYPQGSVGKDLVGSLLTLRVFVVGIVIAIFSSIIIMVLSIKKKPIKLYLFITVFNIALLVLLFIVRNYLEIMQIQIIENRTAFAIRDFTLMGIIGSVLIAFLTSMRSLGFDIKSFEFGQDLHDLNISEEDNEEFEVRLDVDSQGFKRSLNKNIRYFRYFIKEHKLALVVLTTIIIGVGSYFIYSNSGIYFNATKINQVVKINNFSLGIGKSYITNKDYKGNVITSDGNVLLAVPIKIKTNNVKEKINVARFSLNINNNKFYHTTAYKDKIIDLGVTYNDSVINSEFENYVLVFEIPEKLAAKKMLLEYDSESERKVKFKIEKDNIDIEINEQSIELNQILQFNNNYIKDGTLIITNYEFNDKYKLDYIFCVRGTECYPSYEYIIANYKSNYKNTLLKIMGKLNLKEGTLSNQNLYDFISKYGTIVYSINGKTKYSSLATRVLPQKAIEDNVYYLEVLDEIKDAEHITIQFKLRNNVYLYNLR